MKTSEEILHEIQEAITMNKCAKKKLNTVLTDAIQLILHVEKEIQKRLDDEYKRGMNDTWEIAKEFCKVSYDESVAIFETDNVDQIIKEYTLLEIKDKITSYNAKENEVDKIHVGDVVQDSADSTRATILDQDHDTNLSGEAYWMVFTENGCVESWCENNFTKTREAVDVYSALIK